MKNRFLMMGLCAALALGGQVQANGDKPYKVQGDKVDAQTLAGWKAWRSLACERCHGAQQQGMVGPSLIESLKVLSKDDFKKVVLEGRVAKGMPNFSESETITQNIDGLYAFLKGRSDGAIPPGRLKPLE